MQHIERLISKHDFVGLGEAHCTADKVNAFEGFRGTQAFWSHGTNSQAGIGLLVKKEFLDKFNPVAPSDFVEVVPGRAGCLHLQGALCVGFHVS